MTEAQATEKATAGAAVRSATRRGASWLGAALRRSRLGRAADAGLEVVFVIVVVLMVLVALSFDDTQGVG